MKLRKSTFFLGCLVGGMGAAAVPILLTPSHAETELLPFQGRLTDASGSAIPDGAKVVEFKMYDAPTGGTAKWAGEVHKLSVNGGLVNTMLGSKSRLGDVDFATPTYLQITIDANNDNQITAADPPLRPRQSILPAVFATEAAISRAIYDGAVTGKSIAPNTIPIEKLTTNARELISPPGSIVAFAGKTAPDGWLFCDGREVRKSEYLRLYQAIGYTFGGAESSDVFKLPDLTGRVIVGSGHSEGSNLSPRQVGSSGGAEAHRLTIEEIPKHKHDVRDRGHSHKVRTADDANNAGGETIVNNNRHWEHENSTTKNSNADITEKMVGGNAAHNNMQPFLILNYIIKY